MKRLVVRRRARPPRKRKEPLRGWRGVLVRLGQSAVAATIVSAAIVAPLLVPHVTDAIENEALYAWRAQSGNLLGELRAVDLALQLTGDPVVPRMWRVDYETVSGPHTSDPNRTSTYEISYQVRHFVDGSAAAKFAAEHYGRVSEVVVPGSWAGFAVTDPSGHLAISIASLDGQLLYQSDNLPSEPLLIPGGVNGSGIEYGDGKQYGVWGARVGQLRATCLVTTASGWQLNRGVLAKLPGLSPDEPVRICAFRTEAHVQAGELAIWREYLPTAAAGTGLLAGMGTPVLFGGVLAVDAFRRRLRRAASADVPTLMENPRLGSLFGGLTADVNQSLARARMSVEQQRGFVADAAHELRSPLATLITTLEVAERHPNLVDPVQVTRTSLIQAHRLERLTQDLLLLAQLDARTPLRDDVVDLADVVREVVSDSSDPGRPITLIVAGPTPAVGDRDAFRRIVQNLVDNAVRHAATGVGVTLNSQDGQAAVTVTNDGDSIPDDKAERIFERFTRLDDARHRGAGGTGLGLAIARALAERYGGTLDLERGRRHGANLTWRIPVAR